jgi:general secretion pathway protein C
MNLPATFQGLQNLAAGDALAKAGKILPRVTMVVLVAVIAWQAARLTWILLPRSSEPTPVSAIVPPPVSAKGVNAQRIADAHLFGVATAGNDPDDLANVKQSQIPLVLAGTIASGDPTKGFAFIGESAATAKFHKVGDTVGGSAQLHSVYPDKVLLDRGGQKESLLLPRQGSSILGARAAPAVAMTPPPASRFADNIKRIAETNPSAFSEIVRPQALIAQGQMQGFRVYPGRNRQQFAKLGLQPGDLVKAINGTPLDDPQRSGEIFNTLSASDRAQITIERNGQIQQITLNTSQITLPDPDEPPAQGVPPPQGVPPQEMRGNFDANGAPVQ